MKTSFPLTVGRRSSMQTSNQTP